MVGTDSELRHVRNFELSERTAEARGLGGGEQGDVPEACFLCPVRVILTDCITEEGAAVRGRRVLQGVAASLGEDCSLSYHSSENHRGGRGWGWGLVMES